MRVTKQEQIEWFMRPTTGVHMMFHTQDERTYWHAGVQGVGGALHEGVARTKIGAICKSIQIERKALLVQPLEPWAQRMRDRMGKKR